MQLECVILEEEEEEEEEEDQQTWYQLLRGQENVLSRSKGAHSLSLVPYLSLVRADASLRPLMIRTYRYATEDLSLVPFGTKLETFIKSLYNKVTVCLSRNLL